MNPIQTGTSPHLLADAPWDTPWISPGLLGFIIVCILGLATWLLVRSMSKQLRKLDANTPEPQDEVSPLGEQSVVGPPSA